MGLKVVEKREHWSCGGFYSVSGCGDLATRIEECSQAMVVEH